VWRDAPQWPLSAGLGLPMTFFGQVRLPAEIAGDGTWMGYVFFAWYRPHRRKVLQEYAVELEPGPDPETWSTP
jgi:hypothetical protein